MLIVSQLPEVWTWVGHAVLLYPNRSADAWRYAENTRPNN